MSAFDLAAPRLIVSQGPSTPYRLLTYFWTLVALATTAAWFDGQAAPSSAPFLRSLLFGAAWLVMLGLALGWSSTEFHFDRVSDLLVVVRRAPLRGARRREVPLSSVSALVDRRSGEGRTLELVLADRSALVLARARLGASAALDATASRLSALLGRPIELGQGALIDQRFEITRLVRRGGMGAVYRALDRETFEPVALKLILPGGKEGQRDERFAREIELLAALHHPRIAGYRASGRTRDGQSYFAMEWLDGEDLGTMLGRGALSPADSLQVMIGAAEAMARVHERGIIHRDLKPSNLFLRNGSVADLVLLDFGVARRLEGEIELTGSAALIGTPHYMAPEQATSSKQLLPAADVFSLGCIFYECLTGRHPFEAAQLAGVLARILFDVPEPVTAYNPRVPEAFCELLSRMLAKQPQARPADAGALLAELIRLPAAEAGGAIAPSTPPASLLEPDAGDQVLVCVVLARDFASPPAEHGRHDESIKSAMERFGCPIERLLDGSLLATIFPRPSAVDLVRVAAHCALYLREQMPGARIALSVGRAALRKGPRVGDAVDRAAELLGRRLETEGVRLDGVSASLLGRRFATVSRDGVELLLGERAGVEDGRTLLGKPTVCVGRDAELLELEGLVVSAFEARRAKAGMVLGPPGIGKSRVARELERRVRERCPDTLILIGYGDPLSAGSPYVLLGDALRQHANIHAGADPEQSRRAIAEQLCRYVPPAQHKRVSEFLGELMRVPFPGEASPPLRAARGDHRVMSEQIALAFRDWLRSESARQPLLLLLDDAQWGDALTVKLLEEALRELGQSPLSVVVFGRPETPEVFPKLLAERRALSLTLRPLSEAASASLIRQVLGERLGGDDQARLARLAAGNALFLEELIRAAAEGETGDVPESVLAMLQARLSALSYEARLVLRAASVLGETFWRGGVQSIGRAWGANLDGSAWLAHLVELEIVEALSESRFAGETEYVFRHALVCDAARGLLTDDDLASGHRAAGAWLEAAGESDAIVLARHSEQAGDRTRAIAAYLRAAQQSLDNYDFDETLARIGKARALGARAQALGTLESIEASAFYNQGKWLDAARAGLSALEHLARGDTRWCATSEMLMQVLPNVSEFDKSETLSDELLRVVPAPEARTAHVRALAVQLLGCAITGARTRGQACLAAIDRIRGELGEPDLVTRGHLDLWRAVFTNILGDDLELASALAERATHALTESQVMYRVSLSRTVHGFVYWGLGDLERSEAASRQGKAIAEQIHDEYHAALAAWYLGLSLAEQALPDKLDEAQQCAEAMMRLQQNPLFEATSRSVTARVALARGDAERAAAHGRLARDGLLTLPPFRFIASATLMRALVALGQAETAAQIAREDLVLHERVGSPLCSELLLLVAAAEAFHAHGDRARAESTLRSALGRRAERAAKLVTPRLRTSFLEGRDENRRATELARVWFGSDSA